MEKKEQKESIRQPSVKDTEPDCLGEMLERIGAVEVEPPKSVLVIFPPNR